MASGSGAPAPESSVRFWEVLVKALLLRCGRSERSRYCEAAAGEGVASEGESSGPPSLVSESDKEEVFHRFQPDPSSSESSSSDEAPPISGA